MAAKRIGFVVTIMGASYLLGSLAGNFIGDQRRQLARADQIKRTQAIANQMDGPKMGAVIPNYEVRRLDGERKSIDALVSDYLIISFFKVHCDACIFEIESLEELAEQGIPLSRFALVSSDCPFDIIDVTAGMSVRQNVLYDHSGVMEQEIGVFTFPFTIVIDRSRRMRAMMAGTLDEEFLGIAAAGDTLQLISSLPTMINSEQILKEGR